MKHYFFINPVAGQGKGTETLMTEIREAAGELGLDVELYLTKGVGDGEIHAREIAERLQGEPARFYACGGDGTLNEIICGIMGFDHIAIGCIPTGTGNDMVRNFPEAGDFHSIKGQLTGTPKAVDLIWYAGVMDGVYRERYCANMFNIGFDCNVVAMAGQLKKKPLIAGSMAYLFAVLGVFLQKKTIGLRLEKDGQVIVDRDVLLCAVANGSYCGGGIKSSPQSCVSDGLFDLNVINDVSRTTFLKLFPKFKVGKHLGLPGVEKIIHVERCQSLSLWPKDGEFFLCADGEICVAEAVRFEIRPGAMSFIVPPMA